MNIKEIVKGYQCVVDTWEDAKDTDPYDSKVTYISFVSLREPLTHIKDLETENKELGKHLNDTHDICDLLKVPMGDVARRVAMMHEGLVTKNKTLKERINELEASLLEQRADDH